MNKGTFKINVGGLLPFASYNCCVSAIYYGYNDYYTAESRCNAALIEAMALSTNAAPTEMPTSDSLQLSSASNMTAKVVTVGGVLGFIIVILVLLLAICGGALLYILRSRTSGVVPKRYAINLFQ